jgi:hypothetical protein
MNRISVPAVVLLAALSAPASAQQQTPIAPVFPLVQPTDTLSTPHDRGIINQLGINRLETLIGERDRLYGQRFDAQEKANVLALKNLEEFLASRLSAQREAIDKADKANEKRFDSVNEFRTTLKDQQLLLITRAEVKILFDGFDRRMTEIQDLVNRNTNRSEGSSSTIAYIFAALGALVGIAGFLVRSRAAPGA